MATIINAYKTVSYLDAYSKDGANDDPVFPYPPNDFDGDTGQTRDVQLFVRNDGTAFLRDNLAIPVDKGGLGRQSWMKLALTQVGLDSAVAGANLSFLDLDPLETIIIWERMTIPAKTDLGNIISLTVKLQFQVYDE